jgi:hypothetical protein
MNYNLVQREVKTLGEDLTELGGSIIGDPQATQGEAPRLPCAVKAAPDVLAELTCIQQRLSALLNYIHEATGQ